MFGGFCDQQCYIVHVLCIVIHYWKKNCSFLEKEDGEVFNWLTGLLTGLLVFSFAIIIYLVVKIWKPDLRTPDPTRGSENSTVEPNSTDDGSAVEPDNIPESNQEQRKKEGGGAET